MSDDETTRIRKALDFVERFVDESGKINITYIREHVEWQEGEVDRLTTEVSFYREWVDSLLEDCGPIYKAFEALRDIDGPHTGQALQLLESALDGTYPKHPGESIPSGSHKS